MGAFLKKEIKKQADCSGQGKKKEARTGPPILWANASQTHVLAQTNSAEWPSITTGLFYGVLCFIFKLCF